MGGCLALRLAEVQGKAVSGRCRGEPVAGPGHPKLFLLAPVLKHVMPSLPGIEGDIKKPGAVEGGYKRVPVARRGDVAADVEAHRRGTWPR